jgi:alanine racemase
MSPQLVDSRAPLALPARTWVEFNWAALRHNALVARRLAGAAGLLPIVKANAYGHQACAAALALQDLTEYFGVANETEAMQLRGAGLSQNMVLLGPCLPEERAAAVRHGSIVTVSSRQEALSYLGLADKTKPRWHYKIDTGMGRLGQWREDALRELAELAGESRGEMALISTHLSAAESDPAFTLEQLNWFREAVQSLRPLFPEARFHVLNSAGLLLYPEYAFDLVRPGLMLYGVSPLAPEVAPTNAPQLRPVLSWKTRLALIRQLPPGRRISYGGDFVTHRPTLLGLLPVGYADGYFRQIPSGRAAVLVRGRRCPVVGRVTMDQIAVDLTDLPEAHGLQVGEPVVLLGSMEEEEISAAEMAGWAGTIPWHVFTAIGPRVRPIGQG